MVFKATAKQWRGRWELQHESYKATDSAVLTKVWQFFLSKHYSDCFMLFINLPEFWKC